MNIKLKWQHIEELVVRAKKGDKCAVEELIIEFNPLICKISNRIYRRYKQIFPLDDIIRQSRCLLIQLTVLAYVPGGKAHYPHFLEQFLHANLVEIYRPLYTYACKSSPLNLNIVWLPAISPFEYLYQNERVEICTQLMTYVDKTFNEREKDVVNSVMYGNTSRNELARKYHISYTRMKAIYKRIIKKLKEYLINMGIKNAEDI